MAPAKKDEIFILEPIISIQDLSILYDQLKTLLQNKKSINLDFSKCEKLDLASVQLLISFVLQCRLNNKKVRISGPLHPNLSQVLEDADLLRIKGKDAILFEQIKEGGVPIE